MSKMCIDDDLKNVVGGLNTPFDDNDDNNINENPVQKNEKVVVENKD